MCYKYQLTWQYCTSLGVLLFQGNITSFPEMERSAQTVEQTGGNGIWIACCAPILVWSSLLLLHQRYQHHTSLWETPACFWRLRSGFVSRVRSISLLQCTEGDCYPFSYQTPKQRQPQRATAEMVAQKRSWGMNPVCKVRTDVLCRVVTEPQTIFQAPRQAPGQES